MRFMNIALATIGFTLSICNLGAAQINFPAGFDFALSQSEATLFYYYSEQGDFIGQGQEEFLGQMDGFFSINSNFDNRISVSTPIFSVELAAAFSNTLSVGLFEDATRFPLLDMASSKTDYQFSAGVHQYWANAGVVFVL